MEKKGKKKVMVAIDESEFSYNAFMWVLMNLEEVIENTKLFIFAMQPSPVYTSTLFSAALGHAHINGAFSATAELTRLAQEKNMKISLGLLEKARNICADRGIKAETLTEAGNPKETICRAVQRNQIDLLVMGHQDRGTLKRLFQGSLSDYCLDNAQCSVLIVKKES